MTDDTHYRNGGAIEARVAALEKSRLAPATVISGAGVLFTIVMAVGGWVTFQWQQRVSALEANAVRQDVFILLQNEVNRLREGLVPRGEHEGHWREQAASVEALQRQIDDLREDVGGVFTPRDQMVQLQKQIDDMRAYLRSMPMPRPSQSEGPIP